MPIPAPYTNENQRNYIARCYDKLQDEYDTPTAIAICYSKWREKKMERLSTITKKRRT